VKEEGSWLLGTWGILAWTMMTMGSCFLRKPESSIQVALVIKCLQACERWAWSPGLGIPGHDPVVTAGALACSLPPSSLLCVYNRDIVNTDVRIVVMTAGLLKTCPVRAQHTKAILLIFT
jgi:hypothetical protein